MMFESLTKTFDGIRQKLAGKPKLTEENIQEALRQVRVALLEADVNFKVCKDFIQRVQERSIGTEVLAGVGPGDLFIKGIHDALVELMGPEDPVVHWAPNGPTVILMAGLQGTGKTTTCGKLALRFKKEGKRPLLVAADVQRPAAIEQLQVIGRQIDVPVHAEPNETAPTICRRALDVAAATNRDVIILDTAGRLHVDAVLMQEVADIAKQTSPHEVFLVLDANTGQDAVNSAKEFNDRLALTGVILTKLDSGTRGGAALSVKSITGKPIKFVGVGEKLDKLEVFHPNRIADRMLGMGDVVSLVEKAQETIDRADAEQTARQLFTGSITFEDFLKMMGMVKGMGPIKDLMKMIPGVAGNAQLLESVDDVDFLRQEAMIRSMTPKERMHPEILNVSRRGRIARGAGVKVEDVHELIRGFKQMKTQLTEMRRSGLLGRMVDPSRAIEKQKIKELKELESQGKSVLDLPAFQDMRHMRVGVSSTKDKRKKRR